MIKPLLKTMGALASLAVLGVAAYALFLSPADPPATSAAGTADRVGWVSYEEGLSIGKQQGKKVFLHFFSNWCTYCKKMQQETLGDPPVLDYLDKHFAAVKINTDQYPGLAAKYRVQGLPTTWFLTSSGEPISHLPGYVAPEVFLPLLEFVASDSYKTMNFNRFLEEKRL